MQDFVIEYLLKLYVVMGKLPGVMPRKAKWKLEGDAEKKYIAKLYDEIFQDSWGTDRVTPHGVRIIVDLYNDGFFPMKRNCIPQQIPLDISNYIKNENALREKSRIEIKLNRQKNERYKEIIENPKKAREEEFTFSLLSKIFWKNEKKGNSSMEIGGFLVHKNIAPYFSNSGKNKDWKVLFRWNGSDGMVRELKKDSVYSRNRRNDAERNWGLPE